MLTVIAIDISVLRDGRTKVKMEHSYRVALKEHYRGAKFAFLIIVTLLHLHNTSILEFLFSHTSAFVIDVQLLISFIKF